MDDEKGPNRSDKDSGGHDRDSDGQERRPSRDWLRTWLPTGSPPRSVYIHIPFCRHRCGYCNFSVVANRDYLVDRFLNALEQEISWLDRNFDIDTLFLGGGTPSHLSAANLKRLKTILESRFTLNPNAEVTAECNPNDLDEIKAASLQAFGVNRISLGVQSLRPEKLAKLERDHSPRDVARAVELARQFTKSVSMDLIFAAPTETISQWENDLRSALELAPNHLSTYELTYEKGTSFWNRLTQGELQISNEEIRADMYELTTNVLQGAGLQPYEVSSFAEANHQCRHNENYWTGQPYFAFGPGASRFIDGIRETNHRSTSQYLKRLEQGESPVAFSECLSEEDSARELLAIGLRRVVGVNDADFKTMTGYKVANLLAERKQTWIKAGLLVQKRCGDANSNESHSNWRLTFRGRMLCDQIASQIVNR